MAYAGSTVATQSDSDGDVSDAPEVDSTKRKRRRKPVSRPNDYLYGQEGSYLKFIIFTLKLLRLMLCSQQRAICHALTWCILSRLLIV